MGVGKRGIEVTALLDKLTAEGRGWRALHNYLQLWRWPRSNASAREMLLGATGKVQASMGRCSASEQLALAPVLRRFLEAMCRTTGEMAAVRSAILLCDVVELLLATRTDSTTPAALEAAILRHSEAHLAAYGADVWKPKMHYALHLGPMWQKFGCLLACFALERKHKARESFRSRPRGGPDGVGVRRPDPRGARPAKPRAASHATPAGARVFSKTLPTKVPKRMASDRFTKVSYERGLLEDCLGQALFSVETAFATASLEQLHPAPRGMAEQIRAHLFLPGAAEVLISPEARVHGARVYAGDTVVMEGRGGKLEVGEVQQHLRVDGTLVTAVSVWQFQEQTERSALFTVRDDVILVSTAAILYTCVAEASEVGQAAVVLKPFPRAFVL